MRPIDLRNELIFKEKTEGVTTKKLSEKYGLTLGTVRNIIYQEKIKRTASDGLTEDARELRNALYELEMEKGACTMLFKQLRLHGICSLAELKNKTFDEVSGIRGIGVKMTEALANNGLIRN